MLSTLNSILSLLISFGILCLGHGLQNTLVNIRGALENYSDLTIGIMNSGYFAGFIIGAVLTGKYIKSVGQIRTFAALASIISTIALLYALFINPLFWIFLRIIYGICICGAYMVIESWLNALSNQKNRGRILSVYMIINFLSLFLSQIFIRADYIKGFVLFAMVSIFASLSLVPLILSKSKEPDEIYTEPFSIKKLYKISPLSVIGSLFNGIASSAFWAFGALYILRSGFDVGDAALFIAFTFIGALSLQWPIGMISDIFNRRAAVILCSSVSIIGCLMILFLTNSPGFSFDSSLLIAALIFGGFSYPLYSLFISLANDFLKPGFFVKASAALLIINGVGSIIGPILATIFIYLFTKNGLFYFLILIYGFICGFAIYRVIYGRKIPESTTEAFVAIPKTASQIYNLDPRFKKSDK